MGWVATHEVQETGPIMHVVNNRGSDLDAGMASCFCFGRNNINWPKEGFTHREANKCKLNFALELVEGLSGDHFGTAGYFEFHEEFGTFGTGVLNCVGDSVEHPSQDFLASFPSALCNKFLFRDGWTHFATCYTGGGKTLVVA